jgi:hypothetical protein
LALSLGPALELVGAGEVKAIEERAGVRSDCTLKILCLKRRLERPNVTLEVRSVQADVVADRDDDVWSERGSQYVQCVAKELPRVFLVALGREVGSKLVAAHGSRMLAREECQQREATALCCATDDWAGRALYRCSAEQQDPEHGADRCSVNSSATRTQRPRDGDTTGGSQDRRELGAQPA